nr:unnamed protein product [Digitaria exilis]
MVATLSEAAGTALSKTARAWRGDGDAAMSATAARAGSGRPRRRSCAWSCLAAAGVVARWARPARSAGRTAASWWPHGGGSAAPPPPAWRIGGWRVLVGHGAPT